MLDASPDIGEQLRKAPGLQPKDGVRRSEIAGVLISHPDVHCIAGLLSLREEPLQLRVYCTDRLRGYLLEENAIFRILGTGDDVWGRVRLDCWDEIVGYDGSGTGLRFKAFSVPSGVSRPFRILPAYAAVHPENTVGYAIEELRTGRKLVYIPSLGEITQGVLEEISAAHCAFVDGWAWSDDELLRLGILDRTASSLGHMPVGGAGGSSRGSAPGSADVLSRLKSTKVYYVHINNTNPILLDDSEERKTIEALGLGVPHDGLELQV